MRLADAAAPAAAKPPRDPRSPGRSSPAKPGRTSAQPAVSGAMAAAFAKLKA
jgi:hypothetical protein